MAKKVRSFHAASLAALLLYGCEGGTVSPIHSDVKPAKSATSTQAQVTLSVRGMTEKLGLF